MSLAGRRIVLGVAGGIAVYKVVEVASRLVQQRAVVQVAMTRAARAFVTPLTFQAITHHPVMTTVFAPWTELEQGHVSAARSADAVLVAPATADMLAKLAAGMADDPVCLIVLATAAPVVLAPAMESHMWRAPATVENLVRLEQRGAIVLPVGEGRLASGLHGAGRMAEPADIVEHLRLVLGRSGALAGRHLVITAGGTREPIDPVRYLGNRSSGRMGFALARAALDRGARVTLIVGPTALAPPVGCQTIAVETAVQMQTAVLAAVQDADALIMAAAVADFRPAVSSERKLKKDRVEPVLPLELNPDILGSLPPASYLRVGFAAETEDLARNAREKLQRKHLDLIVANEARSSIGAEASSITIFDRQGGVQELPPLPKEESAAILVERVAQMLATHANVAGAAEE